MAVRRAIPISLAVALVTALAVAGTVQWLDRQDTIDGTRRAAAATRAELDRTSGELDAASAGLAAVRAVLAEDQGTLVTREGEAAAAAESQRATETQLGSLQQELASATADLRARTEQRSVLDTCLLGVARALNQAGVGDTGGLARTVRDIEGTCARAGASL
jgi:hypothetical protein